jgi:predicted ATPase
MISEIQIENFKSIGNLSLSLGSVTVLIGENGSGKSNIIEAIGFGGAAAVDKTDDEFLATRGIRGGDPVWTLNQIAEGKIPDLPIPFVFRALNGSHEKPLVEISVLHSLASGPHIPSPWLVTHHYDPEQIEKAQKAESFLEVYRSVQARFKDSKSLMQDPELAQRIAAMAIAELESQRQFVSSLDGESLASFLIFAPENSVLRRFDDEGAIRPLGTKGEGLLKHLQFLASDPEFAKDLKHHLQLLGWFGDLELPTEADEMRGRLRIRDRWLSEDAPVFDQRSANEGFLYLLFYFTLMMSKYTPKFFAIDNIDNALNPKLCAELMRQLAVLAAKHGKQVICTTHNPAILDGLNLNDDMQRLYVVRRDSEGHTVVNRVNAPRPRPDGKTVRLSTAFMEGMLGGLPDHF